MSSANKTKMVKLIERCLEVTEGESDVMDDWAGATTSSGRRTRCLKRKNRIRSNSRNPTNSILTKARNTPAAKVNKAPTAAHASTVGPNESSLKARKKMKVNSLGDPMFSRQLDAAERNASDSKRDAEVIYKECT